MKIQRTLPPAAAPLYFSDLWNGFKGFFLGKRYLKRLEEEMKEYFGVKYVFFVSSGKAALYLILRALKTLRPEKDEVLIPAYTCFSVPSAIVKAGLKVALCDVNASTFDFDHELLKDAISDSTLCVVPDHLFGIPSDMDSIMRLCRERDIFVVEDAAQAMGGLYKGKLLGTIGHVGLFSMGRGKVITCGSGGIILTNEAKIHDALYRMYAAVKKPGVLDSMKEFGLTILLSMFIHPWLYWFPAGLPFLKLGQTFFRKDFSVKRLSGMKAGLLGAWMSRLAKSNDCRAINARNFCRNLGLDQRGEGAIPYLRLPVIMDRQEFEHLDFAVAKRFGINRMYPAPISEVDEASCQCQSKTTSMPSARLIADRLIVLPTHQFVSMRDLEEICRLIEKDKGCS